MQSGPACQASLQEIPMRLVNLTKTVRGDFSHPMLPQNNPAMRRSPAFSALHRQSAGCKSEFTSPELWHAVCIVHLDASTYHSSFVFLRETHESILSFKRSENHSSRPPNSPLYCCGGLHDWLGNRARILLEQVASAAFLRCDASWIWRN